MVAIPKPNTTKQILNSRVYPSNPSRRLGMSSIGNECIRALWYSLHWCSESTINARSKRIFAIGDIFEEMVIADLKSIGIICYRKALDSEEDDFIEITGKKGEKQEQVEGFAGHSVGYTDGRGKGFIEFPNEELLLEFKTMAAKYFEGVFKDGVQKSQPKYYAQAQRYMHGTGLEICCFIAINKNDCSYYFEFIHYDRNYALDLVRKEQSIILSDGPPDKYYSFDHYKCNFCNHNEICHLGKDVQENCRTCSYSDMADGGKWLCTNRNKFDTDYELNYDEQREGCEQWNLGWDLDKY